MINLIESIVVATNSTRRPPYDTLCNQVIGFLMRSNREYKKYPYEWFKALLGVLTAQDKFKLMGDLLTLASTLVDTSVCGIFIKAALATIYPDSIRSSVWTETKTDKERDNHNYVAYGHARFASAISQWSRKLCGDVHFIDVGCGIGDKLILARYFVSRVKSVTGVEINTHTYNLGKFFTAAIHKWLNLPFKVIEGDAFDIDYGEYNLIYLYRPIANSKRMCELYNHVLETMPVDGMMIEVLPMWGWIEKSKLLNDRKRFKREDDDDHLVVRKIA